MKSVGEALFTKSQRKILGLLYTDSDQTFYLNEIVRHAAMGKGAITRELDNLRDAGILKAVKSGNQLRYQANEACPVYSELKNLIRKTVGIADVLAAALSPLAGKIRFAAVYGSIAKGKEKPDSDLDLLIIAENLAYTDVMEALLAVDQQLGRTINPTLYSLSDYHQKLAKNSSFLDRVLRQELIPVIGTTDDIKAA